MREKPKALMLADLLDAQAELGGGDLSELQHAAAELRRLHADIAQWKNLYNRAVNEANGLTNYVEDRPELRSAEKRLALIETQARQAINAAKEQV